MEGKKLLQKAPLYTFAILLLLYFSLFPGIAPQMKAHAGESAGAEARTMNNPAYTFTATNGEKVVTTANPGETTVLIFGHEGCSKTRSTLTSVASCSWVKRSDIRVIFADAEGNSRESVLEQEEGYQCPEMIFCYDTSMQGQRMKAIMTEYKHIFGGGSNTYPFIVLIDQNNRIQNILTGKKTSDEILNEIKKFEEIDAEGASTGSSVSDSGMENYVYGLKSIDGATVSTKARPNETTVLIFGYTTCGNTNSTLKSIDKSEWISRPDIRVVYADDITMPAVVSGSALSMVQEYAKNFTSGKIQFCYDHSESNHTIAFTYLSLYKFTGGSYPFIVLIDQHNKVQNIMFGPKTADEVIAEIAKITKGSPAADGTGGASSNPASPGTSTSGTTTSGSSSSDFPTSDSAASDSTSSGSTANGTTIRNPSVSDSTVSNPPGSDSITSNPLVPGSAVTIPDLSTPDAQAPGTANRPSDHLPIDTVPSVPQVSGYEKVIREDGKLQLKDRDGEIVKGRLVAASDGKRYYADENGTVITGKIVSYGHKKYFTKKDGAVAQNEFCNTEKGSTVFAQADGSLAAGKVVSADGKKYYAKSDCALAKDGFFITKKGNKIYAKASGELMVNQIFKVDGRRYCAKASGALVKNAFYMTEKGKKIYAKASGALVANKVFQIKGRRYCAKVSGTLVQNAFYTLPSGKKVYASASGKILENQIFCVDGKNYYANRNGRIAANKWVVVDNKKYYCSASCKITKISEIS